MFYAGNREAGRAVVNSYCKQKHHLQVPKPEHLLLPKPDLSLNLPPLKMPPQPKPSAPVGHMILIPNIDSQLQVKSSERKLRYCPPRISLPHAFVQGRWDQMLSLRRKWTWRSRLYLERKLFYTALSKRQSPHIYVKAFFLQFPYYLGNEMFVFYNCPNKEDMNAFMENLISTSEALSRGNFNSVLVLVLITVVLHKLIQTWIPKDLNGKQIYSNKRWHREKEWLRICQVVTEVWRLVDI